MSEEYQLTEVTAENGEVIRFRRSTKPGALVEVTIAGKATIDVKPRALLLAIKTIAEEEEA